MRIDKMIANFGAQASSLVIQLLSRFVGDEPSQHLGETRESEPETGERKSRLKLPRFRKRR
jgi:hypothetical protein